MRLKNLTLCFAKSRYIRFTVLGLSHCLGREAGVTNARNTLCQCSSERVSGLLECLSECASGYYRCKRVHLAIVRKKNVFLAFNHQVVHVNVFVDNKCRLRVSDLSWQFLGSGL